MSLKTAAVLGALLSAPEEGSYGLDIARRSDIKSGTLYPILARLETHGWVESEWEQIDESAEGRPRRRYYRLTASGRDSARSAIDAVRRSLSPADP